MLAVHREGQAPAREDGQELLPPELLRAYIAAAKTFEPHFPEELTGFLLPLCWPKRKQGSLSIWRMLHSTVAEDLSCGAEFIAAVYGEMRAQEAAAKVPHNYTTARTLLSMLRLSQALARLRFSDTIAQVRHPAVGLSKCSLHRAQSSECEVLCRRTLMRRFGSSG